MHFDEVEDEEAGVSVVLVEVPVVVPVEVPVLVESPDPVPPVPLPVVVVFVVVFVVLLLVVVVVLDVPPFVVVELLSVLPLLAWSPPSPVEGGGAPAPGAAVTHVPEIWSQYVVEPSGFEVSGGGLPGGGGSAGSGVAPLVKSEPLALQMAPVREYPPELAPPTLKAIWHISEARHASPVISDVK